MAIDLTFLSWGCISTVTTSRSSAAEKAAETSTSSSDGIFCNPETWGAARCEKATERLCKNWDLLLVKHIGEPDEEPDTSSTERAIASPLTPSWLPLLLLDLALQIVESNC